MFDRKPKTKFIGCKVTDEEYNYILDFANEFGITVSNVVVHALAEYIAREYSKSENKGSDLDGSKVQRK